MEATIQCLLLAANEYHAALQQNGLRLQDLPTDTNNILRIPRLFATFLRVRTLFAKTQIITPALIWWYDLLKKVEEGIDPAITDGLGLRNPRDAEELLGEIVNKLGAGQTVSSDNLSGLFSRNYLTIRADLKESRLFTHADRTSATISDDHVILAWGLIIWRFLDKSTGHEILQLADDIHSLLEPNVSDSRRTDGILVALQLAVAGNCNLRNDAIAAALLAWFCSHNINDRQDHLAYWCQQRLSAYCQFIENLLVSSRSGSPEKIAVAPLARLWRNNPEQEEALAVILRRWMLVTWSEGQPEEVPEREWERILLPVVSHKEQLRLTPIALSILSQRPATSMLPSIAECYASGYLATEPHGETRFPVKWPQSMLETLMRWNYTEDVVPALQLLHDNESREKVKEAYKWFVADGLGIRKTQQKNPRHPASVEMAIREHSDPRVYQPDNARSWVHDMARLAVRDDFPEIGSDAQTEILDLFQSSYTTETGNIDRWFFDALWPWALKLDPLRFEQACAELLQKTLVNSKGPNYEVLHHFECLLWHGQRETIRQAIETCLQNYRDQLSFFTVEYILEWLLFHGPDDLLQRSLVCLENLRDKKGHLLINLMSIMELLRMLKPECVVTLARENATIICDVPEWRDDIEMRSRLEYWLMLWANATGEDEAAAEWAINLLLHDCPDQCRHNITRLMSRSAFSCLPSLIQTRASLRACLSNDDILNMLRYGNLPANTRQEMRLLWAGRSTHQIVHSGQMLLLRGDTDGFQAWGHELLLLACKCTGETEHDTIPIATLFELDCDGRISSRGPNYSRGKSTVMCVSPNTWGLDEGVQPGHKGALDTQLEQWRDNEMSLRKWEGFAFRDFYEEYSLGMWAGRYPTIFKEYCNRFFTEALESENVIMKFGAFPNYLLSTMLPLYPADAYKHWSRLRKVSNNRVLNNGADLVAAATWEADISDIADIAQIRKSTLFDAENDEEIMWLSLCAVRSGTEQALISICRDALCSQQSKERALAVSVLAWTSHSTNSCLLADLCKSDPSTWIREHATWAIDVQSQDAACRRAYRKALDMTNELDVSRQLHIMKPALLPSCLIWRVIEEKVASFPSVKCSSRKVALIRHFWRHWDNVSNHQSDTRVLGRRMKEYLRGHKVDHFSETQMAPWWEP